METIEKSGSNNKKGPEFEYTGKLGPTMKESADISYSYSRRLISELYPHNTTLHDSQIHLHVPEGATPKDGMLCANPVET